MSIREMTWALSQADIGPIEKFLLVAMGDSSYDGEWSGSAKRLSEYTNIEESAVPYILVSLEQRGLISRTSSGYDLACGPEAVAPSTKPTKQPIPQVLRLEVFKRDGLACLRCGNDDSAELRADHVVPESQGGPMDIDNLQTLCRSCNSWKGVKTVDFRKPL